MLVHTLLTSNQNGFIKISLLSIYTFVLAACGGGGESSTTGSSPVINQAPSKVVLNDARQTVGFEAANISWSSAVDDTTPVNQLVYEVHISEGGDFSPSADSLKFSGKNISNTVIKNLNEATAYTIKLRVIDAQGLYSVSNGLQITTKVFPPSLTEKIVKLNDTGITWCIGFIDQDSGARPKCDIAKLGSWLGFNQDGETGRDYLAVNGQLIKEGGGIGGFDITKISDTGQKLPLNSEKWDCVLDNYTGLMWEVKTTGGLRDVAKDYRWYSLDYNGGHIGYFHGGENTYSFVQAVNKQGLCSYTDWRLPSKQELHSIVSYGENPQSNFLASNGRYWSSTSVVGSEYNGTAWTVNLKGGSSALYKDFYAHVLLVRTSQ